MRTVFLLAFLSIAAWAETPIEHSNETRFQLDFLVPQAALNAYMPAGWTPNVSTTGAAKDCNLRIVFIDRVTINNPDASVKGKGSNRLAYLVAPVKNPAGENVQPGMVFVNPTGRPKGQTSRRFRRLTEDSRPTSLLHMSAAIKLGRTNSGIDSRPCIRRSSASVN